MGGLVESLRQWRDFYALVGTASATLVGLTFVTASIGGGFFSPERKAGMQSFLSPTIVHFTAILVTCLIAIAPSGPGNTIGFLLICDGLAGLGYCGWICRRMIKHGFFAMIDIVDRLWYALLPTSGYLLVAVAGMRLLLGANHGPEILAPGVILLLLAGIRNAWDMTVFIIERRQT
jgi:hypothetical protein